MAATRRQEYAEATRSAVLGAARARFIADGYAATSADAIAADARVAKGSVFHHYRNKQGLFEAVFEAEERLLLTRIAGQLPAGQDPRGTLAAGSRLFLEACGEPDIRELLLVQAPQALGWERWKALEAKHFLGVVRAVVTELVPATHADLTARLIIAVLDEAALLATATADRAATITDAVAAALAIVDARGADGGSSKTR